MWSTGTIEVTENGRNVKATYQVKHYETGSQFGINQERVSKLWIELDGKCVVSYDRGWDIRPDKKNPAVMNVYRSILKQYN